MSTLSSYRQIQTAQGEKKKYTLSTSMKPLWLHVTTFE
jgi:hypothetical protein